MALLFIDGFDSYGNTNNSAPLPTGIVGCKYSVAGESNMKVQAGRLNGSSLQIGATLSASIQKLNLSSLSPNDTSIIGFAFKFVSILPGTYVTFLKLYSVSQLAVELRLTSEGEISVFLNGSGSSDAVSTGAGILANTWYYLEVKVKCANSPNGTYTVKLNNVALLTETGKDTEPGTNAYINSFYISTLSSNPVIYIDDLYFLDASGSFNNDFLGNMKVETLRPSGDGDLTQWAPTPSGTHYTTVNESQCNNSTYVSDANSDDEDLYTYTDLTTITAGIAGTQISTVTEVSDANSFTLKTPCKSVNTDDGGGSGDSITAASYTTKTRIIETDPATSNAWIPSGINAAQFGVKVGY